MVLKYPCLCELYELRDGGPALGLLTHLAPSGGASFRRPCPALGPSSWLPAHSLMLGSSKAQALLAFMGFGLGLHLGSGFFLQRLAQPWGPGHRGSCLLALPLCGAFTVELAHTDPVSLWGGDLPGVSQQPLPPDGRR